MAAKYPSKRMSRTAAFLAVYTAAWLVCACALLLIHRLYHTSFMFITDGLYQHLAAFRYVQDYLSALFRGNPAGLGIFNFSLGQGNDVLTLLNSYDFTDPVCWLTALLPLSSTTGYVVMIFVKLYLVGLAFGLYCREAGLEDGFFNALGAIAYCFSSATLCTYSRHPNFVNWMYFFPLLMAGGERYWRRGKSGLLIAAVFLNAFVSYYTFFIDAVMFALYVATRALCRTARGEKRFGEAMAECLRTAGVCLAGVLLAMVALLPAIRAFFNNNRALAVSGYTDSMLHYPGKHYLQTLFSLFTAYTDSSYYVCLGMSAACMPALCLLFTKRERGTALKGSLLLCAAMLCVPLAGWVLNGFSYVSNRWSFTLVFYATAALVHCLPELAELSGPRRLAALAITVGYVALFAAYCLLGRQLTPVRLGAMALLLLALAPVLLAGRVGRRAWCGVMAGVVFASALYQCVLTYVPWGANYLDSFQPANSVVKKYEGHSAPRARGLSEGFYRIEESEATVNTDGWNGTLGTSLWWSGLPAAYMDYFMALDLDGIYSNSSLRGLDGRTQLLALASVRYFTAPAKKAAEAPWNYAPRADASNKKYVVYENPDALPIGYVYPGYMLEDDYEGLSALEKQQALMQCAVLEQAPAGQAEVRPETTLVPLDYEITGTEDATLAEGGIRVEKSGGGIRLKADVPENCEVYVVLRGVRAEGDNPTVIIRASRTQGDYIVTKQARLFQQSYLWSVLRDRFSFCLGSGAPGENTFAVSFMKDCTVRYDAIELIAVPMEDYDRQVKALGEAALEDVRVGADRVEGTASLPRSGILQFSIPYSAGWRAWVDGVEAKPLRSGGLYMALPLEAGEHEIALRYRTPWLREGAAVSLLTLVGLLLWRAFCRRRRS